MIRQLVYRLFSSCLSLFFISIIVFIMMYKVSDPIMTILPQNATQKQRDQVRHELELDRPLMIQYLHAMKRILHGNFGYSYYSGRPVAQLIRERIPATLEMAFTALLLSAGIGISLGLFTSIHSNHWLSKLIMKCSLIGVSLPSFWTGLILMMGLSVWLGWLPSNGRGATRLFLGTHWSILTLDGWRHLILPSLTLALQPTAIILRLMHSEFSETLTQPFIKAARARGIPEFSLNYKHTFRCSLIPTTTILGLQFGGLLAFSIVTEWIFQWPGLGSLLIYSIQADRPVVMIYLLLTGALFLGINFMIDLIYVLIDPRIRRSEPIA